MATKIFPFGTANSPFNSFNLFLVAEAYTVSQQPVFVSHCLDFLQRLMETSPFNLSRYNPAWLSVYISFVPSDNSEPAFGTAAPVGRTAFESTFESTSKTLTINQDRFNQWATTEELSFNGQLFPVADFLFPGSPTAHPLGAAAVVLIPPITGNPEGGEMESQPSEDDYYFVATSADGYWHQVVLRTLAKQMGLGDEYELAGDDFLAPVDQSNIISHYNLEYFETPPTAIDTRSLKWFSLFSATQRSVSPKVNRKSGSSELPDLTINTVPITPHRIEFWEGGGRYRTKVYRSSLDCLMRRRIGDVQLPVRTQEVPFCLACRHYLDSTIR